MSDDRTPDRRPSPNRFDPRLARIYHQWRLGRLREPGLVRRGPEGPELDVLVEVDEGAELPRFLKTSRADEGCRVRGATVAVANLERLRQHGGYRRVEAPRRLRRLLSFSVPRVQADAEQLAEMFPSGPPLSGKGVVIGVVDHGCDIAHPNLQNPDGTTRILNLWRQGGPSSSPPAFGYGVAYDRTDIDAALTAAAPYGPSMSDFKPELGSHGTHVTDIAAGNGRNGSHAGVAPEADIIFVDVTSDLDADWQQETSNSKRLLAAVQYVFQQADALGKSAVVNVSVGANGGAHDGNSVLDVGFEALLDTPGHAIVVAAGNAFAADCHASGQVAPGAPRTLIWTVKDTLGQLAPVGSELEVWYTGGPLDVFLTPPGWGQELDPVHPDGVTVDFTFTDVFCSVVNTADYPSTGVNHIDIYVDPNSTPGDWSVRLETSGAAPVTFDAWIELEDDRENSPVQSVFAKDADANGTLSALACGPRTVVVGAFSSSPLGDSRPVASFSSSGPTRAADPTGIRAQKPDLSAPGQFDETRGVEAACATTKGVTRFAGTSQAAPHVTGVIALMMQAASRKLTVEEIRKVLISTASPAPLQTLPWDPRAGHGRVNGIAAITEARKLV